MIIDIIWTGLHWVAILPESKISHQDPEALKNIIRARGYYPGELRY